MSEIKLTVNGVEYSVGSEVSSDQMLVDFLREKLNLCGTKYMCREGGCGVCSVSVVKEVGGPVVVVNSCLVPIMSCHGWEIRTIESIGNRKDGYHPIQKALAENNATQCGYCTPGWVQNMYSLLQNGDKPTMMDIEKSFGGNICRCTGYRPIIETFKKFASDAPADSKIVLDIEDLQICKKTGQSCNKTNCEDKNDWCMISNDDLKESDVIEIKLKDNKMWYKVNDLKSIFEIISKHGYDTCMFVNGNTGKGVTGETVYSSTNIIDIQSVKELQGFFYDQNLVMGVGTSIKTMVDRFKTVAAENENFKYLLKIVEHIELVANVALKNLASLGGNLMMKHKNNGFPSDLYVIFEAVGAYLTIIDSAGKKTKLTFEEFLAKDMNGHILIEIILPPLNEEYKFVSYKVMPRSQNAHAVVNSAFLYKLTSDNKVISARIVFGGLSPIFRRASATEKYLEGKPLFFNSTLQAALTTLEGELVIKEDPAGASVEHRKTLTLALFYKGLITICPQGILNPRYSSGTTNIHGVRPVSEAAQTFQTDKTLWPLNQPIPKVEAMIQCAGEAHYTNDIPKQPREVHAALVLSDVACGDIVNIDASEALKQPGVIAFYTAADIPGVNSFIPGGAAPFMANEEILASEKVSYFNQAIGIIVAETHHIAAQAAKMVSATYKNIRDPITDIRVAKDIESRNTVFYTKAQEERGTDVVKTIKGEFTLYGQMHMMMEANCCLVMPTDEGLECHVTSQWMDGCQMMIAKSCNIDMSKVDVHVCRLGGGFGMKISRSIQIATAAGLVAHKLNRPCRCMPDLTAVSRYVGKRFPCHADYEVAVDAAGVIQAMKYKLYEDNGYIVDETISAYTTDIFNNCYSDKRWDCQIIDTITDTAKNTWCRAPGTFECISIAELIMEHIAYKLSLDPLDVRMANVDKTKYKDIIEMVEELKITSNYAERKANVEKFNKENRWWKRGLRCSLVRWTPVGTCIFDVNLTVLHGDGTVIITHGGIEMGQGINTKAVQVCAYLLNIPIDKIQIKGNNTIIAPNCFATGGSIGSQNVCIGIERCCKELLERLKPVRTQLGSPTWLELILKAYALDVDLQVHSYVGQKDVDPSDVFAAVIAEVTIDVLTGQLDINRVDILEDAGQSTSPLIDIGQIEGSFVMGIGFWTCEDLIYDRSTGELLTDRTWTYHVPLLRDIPQTFNVALRKDSYSMNKIMGAKVTGEPPICMSVVISLAIRAACVAAQKEVDPSAGWFDKTGPFTTEAISLASKVRKEDFLFT